MALNTILDEPEWATRRWFAPLVPDQVFNSNTVTAILRKMARTIGGGRQLYLPSLYARTQGGGWISKAGQYSAPTTEQFGAGRLNWKILTEPVVILVADLLENSGSRTQRFDIVKQKNMATARTMGDDFGNALFSLDYSNTNALDSLDHAISNQTTTGNETGFSATYAEITRAASGDTSVWNANVDNATTSMTMGALHDMWNDCSEGVDQPTLIASNNKAQRLYYELLTPIQRQGTEVKVGRGGFRALMFNDVPWVIDSHIASADRGVQGLGSNKEYVYFINSNYVEITAHEEAFFAFMGVKEPIDQWSAIGRYFFMGNVLCLAPRFQGKFAALTQ